MTSHFTRIQWQWVADRYREGYTLTDLGEFLGIHRNSVRLGLVRMGFRPEVRGELPPLPPRRSEFLRLTRIRGAERDAAMEKARETGRAAFRRVPETAADGIRSGSADGTAGSTADNSAGSSTKDCRSR